MEAKELIINNQIGVAVDSGDYIKLAEINNLLLNKYNLYKFAKNSKNYMKEDLILT